MRNTAVPWMNINKKSESYPKIAQDIMLKTIRLVTIATASVVFFSLCCSNPPDPLKGNIKVYPPQSPDQQQPPVTPPATPPMTSQLQTTERHITVTANNSIFSIGLPPGYCEEREVSAQKPIDFWFEYLTPDMSLEVNGNLIEIPIRRTDKVGYTTNVTTFKYVLKNNSVQYRSYNLHMLPSKQGDSIPVVTREKWIAP